MRNKDSNDLLTEVSGKLEAAFTTVVEKAPFNPDIAVVLGSGLGEFSETLSIDVSIPYTDIPGFPRSTVPGHSGNLVFAKHKGQNLIVFQGRFHFYEGYSMNDVVLPIRLARRLGANNLIVSNASGGVNPEYEIGDIMVINDHINLFSSNPLIGKNNDALGPRFPDMSKPYDEDLSAKIAKIGREKGISVREGVYAGLSGPTLETPAEYRYIRIIGADAVGMSTVPEVIAARHMDMRCVGLSVITDLGVPGKIKKVTHEEVVEVASRTSPMITEMVNGLLAEWNS